MHKIRYFGLCLMFFTLIGCKEKDVYTYVPKQYLPIYNVGDTIIYKSGNNYDTFIYKYKNTFTSGYDHKYNEVIYNGLTNSKRCLSYPDCVQFTLNSHWRNIYINWFGLYDGCFFDTPPTIDRLIINGNIYTEVFELHVIDTTGTPLRKCFFTYKNWMIRYIEKDSTTWDLYATK
jgi:hypothetical protein